MILISCFNISNDNGCIIMDVNRKMIRCLHNVGLFGCHHDDIYNCDDSGQLCQVQYDSCCCPELRPGYPELMSLVHFRFEYLSDIWTPTVLGVEVSLSALMTYFWQLFRNRTVQCGHVGVSFYEVGSQVYMFKDIFISLRDDIISGFPCVKTYK